MKLGRLYSLLLILLPLTALYGCTGSDSSPAAKPFNLVIYSTGVFGDTSIPLEDQKGKYVNELISSGYTTLIHATFHVYPGGKIVLNGSDTWLIDESGNVNYVMLYLKDIYGNLKQHGITVFASIGGGGGCCFCVRDGNGDLTISSPPQSNWDYSRVMTFYNDKGTDHQFFKNLVLLKTQFGIDGIDLNYEPKETHCGQQANPYAGYDADFTKLLVDLIKYLKQNDMKVIATPWMGGIPMGRENFWPNVITQTIDRNGPMLDWLQVQQYSGSDVISDWKKVAEDAGVQNPLAFVAAGYSCSQDSCNIQDLDHLTTDIKNTPAGLDKFFLWQYKAMIGHAGDNNCDNTAAEYAHAIRQGFALKP
ncbi:MAG: hypothetical protein EG826_10520 [Deltaproteobacteria bacterium]|nr:hypothetical protein [Deltaproteobacteria bacterium]